MVYPAIEHIRRMHRRPQRRRAGFSLIELLVSMGIMVIGLVMAGTLFPAAIKQTSRSTDDTIGTIICQNALAVAKARLTHADMNGSLLSTPNFDNVTAITVSPPVATNQPELISEADLAYPAPRTSPIATTYLETTPTNNPLGDWCINNATRPTTNFGAIVLARQIRAGENDYQLVVISYKKKVRVGVLKPHENIVIAEDFDVSLRNDAGEDFTRITVASGDLDRIKKGTAIIIDEDDIDGDSDPNEGDALFGVFAKVVAIDASGKGRLDTRLPEHKEYPSSVGDGLYFLEGTNRSNIKVWVVYETDSATGNPVGNTSPTMSIFTTRTALND